MKRSKVNHGLMLEIRNLMDWPKKGWAAQGADFPSELEFPTPPRGSAQVVAERDSKSCGRQGSE
jgi:hypothetical protein